MTYRIQGLEPGQFARFFASDEAELTRSLTHRVIAGEEGRYPCRVSLRDADPGDELVLTHFTNHAVDTPYRNAYAIYVRKDAGEAADYIDEMPPILRGRPIALRGYDAGGCLHTASLALQDDVDRAVDHLERARDQLTADAGLSLTLGRLYVTTQQSAKAIELLNELLDAAPRKPAPITVEKQGVA